MRQEEESGEERLGVRPSGLHDNHHRQRDNLLVTGSRLRQYKKAMFNG